MPLLRGRGRISGCLSKTERRAARHVTCGCKARPSVPWGQDLGAVLPHRPPSVCISCGFWSCGFRIPAPRRSAVQHLKIKMSTHWAPTGLTWGNLFAVSFRQLAESSSSGQWRGKSVFAVCQQGQHLPPSGLSLVYASVPFVSYLEFLQLPLLSPAGRSPLLSRTRGIRMGPAG